MASEIPKQSGFFNSERRAAGGARGGRPVWELPEITEEEVAELMERFPKVVRLPEEKVRAVEEEWRASTLVARSLGRRVSPEGVARELRLRGNLKGEVTVLAMAEKILLIRFTTEEDRSRALLRPWIISGQLLAVEPWRPGFRPTSTAIQSAMVWVRLPTLPVEYWEEDFVREIMEVAGDLAYMDDCTVHRRRLGFARVAVRVNLKLPLCPGVIMENREGRSWQRFVYEGVAGVCFGCGLFHEEDGRCPAADGGAPASLRPENISVEGEGEGGSGSHPRALGPWISVVRKWLPPELKKEAADRSRGSGPDSVRSRVVEKGKAPTAEGADRPGSSPETDGWNKPRKIARRRSPARSHDAGGGSIGASSSGGFGPLSGDLPGKTMLDAVVGTRDSENGKRARSPSGPSRRGPSVGKPGQNPSGIMGQVLGEPTKGPTAGSSGPITRGPGSDKGDDLVPFVFSAGSMGTNGPITGHGAQVPSKGEMTLEITHEEAAGRLRQIIQLEGGGPVESMDSLEVDSGDHQGGPRGGTSTIHLDL